MILSCGGSEAGNVRHAEENLFIDIISRCDDQLRDIKSLYRFGTFKTRKRYILSFIHKFTPKYDIEGVNIRLTTCVMLNFFLWL